MNPGPPDSKRPRLSTGSWSAGGSHHGVSLLHPAPSPAPAPAPAPAPSPTSSQPSFMPLHHSAPPPITHYQQSRLSIPFARPSDHHHHSHPPPPLPAPIPHPQPPPPPQQQPPPPPPSGQPYTSLPGHPPLDDRRHHEPERLPPMQEHRPQPPLSPAPRPCSPYAPRDPMVKPDPGDETLPQVRRPLSTGAPPDGLPGQQHSGLPSQPYPPDEKRHLAFDNGPPTPHLYRQQSYPPPTPTTLPHTPSHEYYAPYGPPPASDMAYPIHITSTGKRKAQRASQACDNCRALKAKCDEMKPCKSCKEKKVECKYRETVPKQQDKLASDMYDGIMAIRNELMEFNKRLAAVEHVVKRNNSTSAFGSQADAMLDGDERPGSVSAAPPTTLEDNATLSPGETNGTEPQRPNITTTQAHQIDIDAEQEPELESSGPVVHPGAPAIPPNHTTQAALLLKWRSIRVLLNPLLEQEGIKSGNEFPLRQEERRGILRVWGRGEGQGQDNGRLDRDASHDQGMVEVRDDYSELGAPSPADCWGGIGSSPGPADTKVPSAGGPVTRAIDFSEKTAWRLVRSYEDNIQNMHPLIPPKELQAMVKLFLDEIAQSSRHVRPGAVAKFVQTQPPETGVKRKRTSPAPEGPDYSASTPPPKSGRPSFQRTVSNAVVLLVLALGRICEVPGKIPDVVSASELTYGSPVLHNGHPASPVHGSPPSLTPHSQSSGLPSPQHTGPSRRPSTQTGGGGAGTPRLTTSFKRNMDVIPGLDYFAYATDILGGQLAGNSFRHVYAHILAGLYHGQLGRVIESFTHIRQASLTLYTKLYGKFGHFRNLAHTDKLGVGVASKYDNKYAMAFWTILQLESDIVAELPLPQTYIMNYEEEMPYPNIGHLQESGFEDRVCAAYHHQLFLRKRLNEIHRRLYDPDSQHPRVQRRQQPYDLPRLVNVENANSHPNYYPDSQPNFHPNSHPDPQPQQNQRRQHLYGLPDLRDVQAAEEILKGLGTTTSIFWTEQDNGPAGDLVTARARAKYWGAQVILYRPFISYVLETNQEKLEHQQPLIPDNPPGEGGPDRDSPLGYPEPTIVKYAKKGIKPLVESTRAFHGLGEKRPIITNVFGTAHAQWGNLITLAAVSRDPTLRKYVDRDLLKELFTKTISFFRMTAQPSSALSIDLRILEGLERELEKDLWNSTSNLNTDFDPRAQPRFSSSSSHMVPSFHQVASMPSPGPPPRTSKMYMGTQMDSQRFP